MNDCAMIGWIQAGVSFVLGALVSWGFFAIQEKRSRRSENAHTRHLENSDANRHNSAVITRSGTTVTPETGEANVEGFAPTVAVRKPKPPSEGNPAT